MADNNDPAQAERQREALITLTAMQYIEDNTLLEGTQLSDAKKSLQALFLRTSGAETMLRRLIEMLKVKRSMHTTFSRISGTFLAIRRSVESMEERVENLRRLIERSPVSPEANTQFVGGFMSFAIRFVQRIVAFERALQKYLVTREQEARMKNVLRVAEETRERLRQRLTSSTLAQASSVAESRIKDEVTTSVNFQEAEAAFQAASRLARAAEAEVQEHLNAIMLMTQATTDPAKRERGVTIKPEDDMFARFNNMTDAEATQRIGTHVRELFLIYQRAHGMFQLDFDRLKQALRGLEEKTSAYFNAKDDDRDMNTKRERLRKIEALIQFMERAALLAGSDGTIVYERFSKALSEAITEKFSPWSFAAEDLLTAKVRAEAEMKPLL